MHDGYEIATAQRGRAALDRAMEIAFNLAMTDLIVPGVEWPAPTQVIRGPNSGTVVVWVTVHGCAQVSDEATRLSVCECLEKPKKIGEIRRVVQEAWKDSRDQR